MSPRPLLAWLDEPSADRGIHFAGAEDTWDFRSYARLAEAARRVAAGLADAGVPAGSVVTVVQRSGPLFVASLFGALAAGCTPSPTAPPLTFQDSQAYAGHVTGLMRTARPQAVVADRALIDLLRPLAAAAGVPRVLDVEELAATAPDGPARPPADLALLQFTSGSSGAARGIRVPYPALEANVEAIRGWLAMTEDDSTASWLPVHHDMGLIGCLLTPVVNGSDVWLMQPEQFVQRPLRYLRCFGERGAQLTAMPNFGLSHLVRRVPADQLEGFDLSRWRAIIVGAERLDPAAFDAFHRLLAPHGLDRRALLPAYGLAESTLAVTGLPLAEEWSRTAVDPAGLAPGEQVTLLPADEGGQELVGCGRPLGAARVAVEDPDGGGLPDGTVGEIVVRGPSVAAGYVETGTGSSRFDGDALRTGDAGFLRDGQLHVLGRLGDSIKVRGRSVFAEDVEAALGAVGVPPLRVAALLGERAGRPTVVVLFEHAHADWLAGAAALLRPRIEGAGLVVLDAPRGAIARTSSGKPRRRAMWRDFLDDRLPGTVVPGSGTGSAGATRDVPVGTTTGGNR